MNPLTFVRLLAWTVEHGAHLRQISDECRQIFLKAIQEKNIEQVEALKAEHDRKAEEYQRVWSTRPQ